MSHSDHSDSPGQEKGDPLTPVGHGLNEPPTHAPPETSSATTPVVPSAASGAQSGPTEGSPSGTDLPTPATAPSGWYPDPNAPGTQRYWDGSQWTEHAANTTAQQPPNASAAVSTVRRPADERKALLAQQIQFMVAQGRRVESQSDFQAVLVSGKPVNHVLHAILTIFTCLIWGIVWAVLAATGGATRELLVVDEFGNVTVQQLGKA